MTLDSIRHLLVETVSSKEVDRGVDGMFGTFAYVRYLTIILQLSVIRQSLLTAKQSNPMWSSKH